MTLYATRAEIEEAFGSAIDDESSEMIDDLMYQLFSKVVCASFDSPRADQCIDSFALRDIVLRMVAPTDLFARASVTIDPDSALGEFVHGLIGLGECIVEARIAHMFGVSRAVASSTLLDHLQRLAPAGTIEERTQRFACLLAYEAREPIAGVQP